jgi:RNA polymerase sigma-70 factor (ECF subfamily)
LAGAGIFVDTSRTTLRPDFLEQRLESATTAKTEVMPPVVVADLYRAHHVAIFRLCSRYLRDNAEAEDATQETFLAAHKSLLGGTSPVQPLAWLATIARNTCWERAQRRMREPLGVTAAHETSARADAFTDAVRSDERAQLLQAVGELPNQQQKAFVLCEVAGHSYSEAASRLDVSESALDALLVRARRRLRQRLQPLAGSVQGIAGFPLALLNRLGGGADGVASTAATAARAGALPVAAKLAAATVSVAVIGGGSQVAHDVLDQVPSHHAARTADMQRRVTSRPLGPQPATVGRSAPVIATANRQPGRGLPSGRAGDDRTNEAARTRPTSRPADNRGGDEQPVAAATSVQPPAAATAISDDHRQPTLPGGDAGGSADQMTGDTASDSGGSGTAADPGTSGDQAPAQTPDAATSQTDPTTPSE